jgi:hypothetical protein
MGCRPVQRTKRSEKEFTASDRGGEKVVAACFVADSISEMR